MRPRRFPREGGARHCFVAVFVRRAERAASASRRSRDGSVRRAAAIGRRRRNRCSERSVGGENEIDFRSARRRAALAGRLARVDAFSVHVLPTAARRDGDRRTAAAPALDQGVAKKGTEAGGSPGFFAAFRGEPCPDARANASAGADRRVVWALPAVPAARCHRQRQDRGLFPPHRADPRARHAGAGPGSGDQPHARSSRRAARPFPKPAWRSCTAACRTSRAPRRGSRRRAAKPAS